MATADVEALGVSPATGHAAWHEGERAMQALARAADVLGPAAPRILKPYMTEQHRAFFPLLPFLVVGWVDEHLQPWATLLPGEPGFAWSPDPTRLRVDAWPPAADPLHRSLGTGVPLGLLGIELPTRRRNRLNGVVAEVDEHGFTVAVRQSFGNCPQYIQRRSTETPATRPVACGLGRVFDHLDDEEARHALRLCDTLFVASYAPHADGGAAVDVSHRGGRPGFVRVDGDGRLTIPDFSGNRYFNTLGNVLATGRAGLVVPAFGSGDLLLITGRAAVGLSAGDRAEAARVEGAERIWRVEPTHGLWLRGALPWTFHLSEWSPRTLATGRWDGEVGHGP